MMITDMSVLVTGGAGAIGANLVRSFLARNCQVTVVDDLSSGRDSLLPQHSDLRLIRGDISRDEVVREVFETRTYDVVFHLAALFANQNSVDHPQRDLEVNGMGTLKILEASQKTGVKRFVYSSSSCVYEDSKQSFTETFKTKLDTPYSITKLLGEQYTLFFFKSCRFPVTIVRYFNNYGPGEYPGKYRNVIPNFFDRARKQLPLILTGTGKETRDFTFVDDTVRGTILAAEADAGIGEVFNLGTGRETTIEWLARHINRITGNPAGIEYRERRGWDLVSSRCSNIKKARSLLGYKPSVQIEEGLLKTHDWFVKHVPVAGARVPAPSVMPAAFTKVGIA
jgi:UDP-glucose 4-epimerase